MKEKNLQPRLLYPARISFRFDGEVKSFSDKQKLKEFSTTKPALQQMLKKLLQAGNTREEKDPQTPNQAKQLMYLPVLSQIYPLGVQVQDSLQTELC